VFALEWPMIETWLVTTGLRVLLMLLLTWGLWWLLRISTGRLKGRLLAKKSDPEAERRVTTLTTILRGAGGFVLLVTAGMVIISQLGVKLGPMVAAAGIGGLAIGFGAQNLVRDVISGFFILLEDQVRVGDVVQLNGQGGLVEDITLRHIRLRDLAGTVHYFPNGSIDRVANMTKQFSFYLIDFGVAYREDTDEVFGVMRTVVDQMRAEEPGSVDILEPLEILGVDRFADSAVILRARIKTRPLRQWATGREFNRRLKKALNAADIEIPYPHQTIYWGEHKGGQPAKLHVVQESD
jgi:moderate conductance mechanosensitive channel